MIRGFIFGSLDLSCGVTFDSASGDSRSKNMSVYRPHKFNVSVQGSVRTSILISFSQCQDNIDNDMRLSTAIAISSLFYVEIRGQAADLPWPTRELEWKDVNFLSVSDTHGRSAHPMRVKLIAS